MQQPQLTLDLFCEVLDGPRVSEPESSLPLGEPVVNVGQGGDDGGKRRGRSRGHFGGGEGDGTWEGAACCWASIPAAHLRQSIAAARWDKTIQFLVTKLGITYHSSHEDKVVVQKASLVSVRDVVTIDT